MWGYGILGIASLFAVPFYLARPVPLDKAIAAILGVNGIMSIVGALITAFALPWVFTMPGLVTFALWNVVMLALGGTLFVSFRRQANPAPRSAELKLARTH